MALFRRLILAAVAAGALAGTTVSAVQQVTTVPLILEAERYEGDGPATAGHAHGHSHSHDIAAGDAQTHGDAGTGDAHGHAIFADAERLGFTVLANLMVGVAYALLLGAAWLLTGAPMDARRGLLWGAGGFVAFTLAPAVGLPPELPGMAGGELAARQLWWMSAAVSAAAGLLALAFGRNRLVVAAGLAIAALPHLVGAPHADAFGGAPPPELAARFAALSIGVAALFWLVLGAASGAMLRRLLPAQS
ncbi:CbtA family protein [Azospirillum sp. SYSU D00513]|uniref:CbtA family protein n=1 Tax=Azospirillum sp. SYSU D00513 TaxID=2812561 RepID=UPI001A95712D|nr:CbtA family protein [Azospirillum sp. SYSU D00513]